MKTCLSLLACLMMSAISYAAKDAAIEAQEGSVEHWIEYYKKERSPIEVPAAVEVEPTISEQKSPKQRDWDTSPIVRPPKSIDQ